MLWAELLSLDCRVKKHANHILLILSFPLDLKCDSMAFTRKRGFVNINWLRLILGNTMSFSLIVCFYPKAKGKCVSLIFVFIGQVDVVTWGTHCPRGCWWLPPGIALSQRMLPHSNSRSFLFPRAVHSLYLVSGDQDLVIILRTTPDLNFHLESSEASDVTVAEFKFVLCLFLLALLSYTCCSWMHFPINFLQASLIFKSLSRGTI